MSGATTTVERYRACHIIDATDSARSKFSGNSCFPPAPPSPRSSGPLITCYLTLLLSRGRGDGAAMGEGAISFRGVSTEFRGRLTGLVGAGRGGWVGGRADVPSVDFTFS